jgi:hypothetical protein
LELLFCRTRRGCAQPSAAKQIAEKHDPSAAKACTEEKRFIAALKRCATQNHCFSAKRIDFVALTARLEAAPFQSKIIKQNHQREFFRGQRAPVYMPGRHPTQSLPFPPHPPPCLLYNRKIR